MPSPAALNLEIVNQLLKHCCEPPRLLAFWESYDIFIQEPNKKKYVAGRSSQWSSKGGAKWADFGFGWCVIQFWTSRNFPDPNLECNSGCEGRFSPHLSSVSMSLAPWRSLTVGYVGDGTFRCRKFIVSIAGWSTWDALGGSYLWNACRSWDFPNESSPVTWWIHVFV